MADGPTSERADPARPDARSPDAPLGAFSLRLPARAAELRTLRRAVSAWLDGTAFAGAGHHGDAVLVVSELFTNAIEAGANDVETMLWRSGLLLRIVVTDDGPDWLPTPTSPEIPDPTAFRGRGLALTSRLGRLVIDRIQQRTRVMVTIDPS